MPTVEADKMWTRLMRILNLNLFQINDVHSELLASATPCTTLQQFTAEPVLNGHPDKISSVTKDHYSGGLICDCGRRHLNDGL